MKIKILAVTTLACIAILITTYFSKSEPSSTSTSLAIPESETTSENVVGGMYFEEYSKDYLEIFEGQKTVLFFYAKWCPTCRPVDEELKENANLLPKDVVVIRVNYNDDQVDEIEEALAEKYTITYQHTFVLIDKDGNEIKKWNGGDLNRIIAEVK